jgi:pimeloyl-ACP methyl ester carboxylesterase
MKKVFRPALIVLALLVLAGSTIYWWFPGIIVEGGIRLLRWRAGLTPERVQVDDHRWVYLEGGEGETILFVHGFGANKDTWGPFLKDFSKDYRLVVPDLPGFGENSKVASANYDIPHQVQRLHRFVQSIGLNAFHLVGTSLGGYIAAYYASEYPDNVKSLALIDAAGVESRIPSTMLQRYRESGENLLLFRTPEEFGELMSLLYYEEPEIPKRLQHYFVERATADFAFYEAMVEDILGGGLNLLEGRLSDIQAKTLIIWGANDEMTHVSSVEKFENGIAHTTTVIIDQCGHAPFLEKPQETERAYRSFLAELP